MLRDRATTVDLFALKLEMLKRRLGEDAELVRASSRIVTHHDPPID